MAHGAALHRPAGSVQRATRQEHIERMWRVEELMRLKGWTAADTSRQAAREFGITHRQADRYVTAIRSIYARAAERQPLMTREEWMALVMADHARCVSSEEPDWRAAQKLLETIARANGWYAPRRVEHSGTVEHTHTASAVALLSPDEQAALAAYHEARLRREAIGQLVEAEPAIVVSDDALHGAEHASTSEGATIARQVDPADHDPR